MKSRIYWSLTLGVAVAGLLVVGSASPEGTNQVTKTVAAVQSPGEARAVEAPAAPPAAAEQQDDESGLANAAVQPISTGRTFPPNLKLTEPVLEVIRLAESGLDESVLMAFVTNSVSAFNLGAEEIIYLNDIGVPGLVVAAMIERDRTLKELAASGVALPAEPVSGPTTNWIAPEPVAGGPYAPQPVEAPVGAETAPAPAPQPDYAVVDYAPPPAVAVSYSTFYDSLAPYGTWLDVSGWGPCWRPTVVIVNPGWRPYCNGGRWIYSDCGWYWLSGYSWGWAPFHYGRWFRHSRWGWCWAPGSVWGPAWVGWRYGGGYCGWAPLPPAAGFRAGIGLTYYGRPVRADFGFGIGTSAYTFVGVNHFRDRHLNRYAVPHQEAARVFDRTTPSSRVTDSNHRIINHGIPPSRIATATREEIREVRIRPVTRPAERGGRGEHFVGDGRTLAVYRPQFPAGTAEPAHPAQRLRPESRSGGTTTTLTPTPQRAPLRPSPRASAASDSVRSSLEQSAPSSSERPTARSVVTAPIRSSSEPATITPRRDAVSRPVSPVSRRESDRPSGATARSSVGTVPQSSPRPTATVPARTDSSPRPTITRPATRTIEIPQSRPVSPSRDTFTRSPTSTRPQPLTTPSLSTPTRPEQPQPTSRASELRTRIEQQRQYRAPSSPTPASVPRTTPMPTFSVPRVTPSPARSSPTRTYRMPTPAPTRSTPAPTFRAPTPAPARSVPAPVIQRPAPAPTRSVPAPNVRPTPRTPAPTVSRAPTRSISRPAASPAPRPQATPSRPAPSASSTPATSAPRGPSRSSSGPRGR